MKRSKVGRMMMAMKGKVDPKELDAVSAHAPENQYSLEVENYTLPSMKAPRSIVIIKHLHQNRSQNRKTGAGGVVQ